MSSLSPGIAAVHTRASVRITAVNHFYRDVPGLGNVAVARHAQDRMAREGVPPDAFERALLHPTKPDVADGMDVLWREREGLRIVILTNPTPNRGAKLVKTVYRIEQQAKAR
jgi:hypothetical protein